MKQTITITGLDKDSPLLKTDDRTPVLIRRRTDVDWERAEISKALQGVLVGGNHLASAMLSECPPTNFKNYEQALKAQGQPYADMWAAWSAIMHVRDAIEPPTTE